MTIPGGTRAARRPVGWRAYLPLLVFGGLTACAGTEASLSGGGAGGASGAACVDSGCVPAVAVSLPWFIEVDPPSGSSGAVTELANLDFTRQPLTLPLEPQATVAALFTAPANATVPASASVVLSVPSTIPGHAPLVFQAGSVTTASTDSSSTLSAALTVPTTVRGQTATLSLIPLPPADQTNPPYAFPVTVGATVNQALPAGTLSLNGQIESAIGKPLTDSLVARVFQNGSQVSNAPLTQTDGTFQLVVGTVDVTKDITVQLAPTSPSSPDPWFTSTPIGLTAAPSSSLALGTIMLPAYSNLNLFNVKAVGPDGTTPVSGALVQAQSVIGPAYSGQTQLGSADFVRNATTNSSGVVGLSLLPGTATAAIDYDITVNPPASSPYATQCLPAVAAVTGANPVGSASAPTLVTAVLAPRPVLTGTVTDSYGRPVASVTVTATSTTTPSGDCPAAVESSASTSTSATGTFSLPLDPGTYQLDYDPPAGSSAPRFTELAVDLGGTGQVPHDVTLPRGGLVSGQVVDPSQVPLSGAVVRLFEARCSDATDCASPWLRGQAVTDTSGSFRVVVPLPAD